MISTGVEGIADVVIEKLVTECCTFLKSSGSNWR